MTGWKHRVPIWGLPLAGIAAIALADWLAGAVAVLIFGALATSITLVAAGASGLLGHRGRQAAMIGVVPVLAAGLAVLALPAVREAIEPDPQAIDVAPAASHTVATPTKTQLASLDLRSAHLQGVQLDGADLRGRQAPGALLNGASLRGSDLRGLHAHGIDLRGADLHGADLRGADLSGGHLDGACLIGAQFDGAILSGSSAQGASAAGADGLPKRLRQEANGGSDCPQ